MSELRILARWLLELLRRTMEREGFSVHEHERRHFDSRDRYRIRNAPLHRVGAPAS